jgi:sigma-B regulation protein RsbU (phosphoserine phosphatase)
MSAGIRSVLAAPLLAPEGALGMIVLASRLTSREFNEEDMELLTSLASVAALQIRNLRLAGEAAERRRLEQEVTLAREIQVALLPERLPEVEGWELHAGNLPSRGVSGDFYKVNQRLDGSECVMLLADVSGKGIAASLLTASLEALTANLIEAGGAPDVVCSTASRLLFERTPPEKFATLFLGIVHTDSGTFSYCNAGHNPALVVRGDGSSEWLESTGMPVGMLPMGSWTAGEVELGPGDLVLLYTDGITEAENPDEEEYGNERLESVVRRWREDPLPDLLRAIDRDLNEFAAGVPFADDRTMVVIRRAKAGQEG